LVAFGEDRETARRRLLRALREYVILGVQTTISFLLDVLDHPAFVAGETGTDFIPRHFSLWSPPAGGSFPPAVIAAYLAALQRQEPSGNVPPAGPAVRPPSPWQLLGNWKM
jgi:acetyl/propionyl-CoA carboxylase alpha subunit